MSRNENAFVAYVFPVVVKVKESVEQFLELIAVMLDGFHGHYLAHIRSARRISHHACASSYEDDRCVAEFLHIHHYYDLHEMSHVQAVGCRVESYIKLYFFVLQELTNFFFVGGLLYKTSFFQHIVNIIKFADVIRYKIEFHQYSP